MIRRFGFAVVMLVFTAVAASAGTVQPYKADAFAKALADGKTIVVHVHADWCPVCRKQQPTVKSLSEDSALAKVEFVQVNFDKDQDFLTANGVSNQSVILVFKGGKEVARLNGTTDAAEISSRIKAAVS